MTDGGNGVDVFDGCEECPIPTRIRIIENDMLMVLGTISDVESRLAGHLRNLGSQIDRLADIVQTLLIKAAKEALE